MQPLASFDFHIENASIGFLAEFLEVLSVCTLAFGKLESYLPLARHFIKSTVYRKKI